MVNNMLANAGDPGDSGLIPRLGRSLEKEMATHSSMLAWKISWREEPGGLQSMGSQRRCHESSLVGMCSVLSCVQPLVTPWTVAHQALLSMRFSRQE